MTTGIAAASSRGGSISYIFQVPYESAPWGSSGFSLDAERAGHHWHFRGSETPELVKVVAADFDDALEQFHSFVSANTSDTNLVAVWTEGIDAEDLEDRWANVWVNGERPWPIRGRLKPVPAPVPAFVAIDIYEMVKQVDLTAANTPPSPDRYLVLVPADALDDDFEKALDEIMMAEFGSDTVERPGRAPSVLVGMDTGELWVGLHTTNPNAAMPIASRTALS